MGNTKYEAHAVSVEHGYFKKLLLCCSPRKRSPLSRRVGVTHWTGDTDGWSLRVRRLLSLLLGDRGEELQFNTWDRSR